MKLSVSYRAEYAYDEPVSLSPHVVRLFPRDVLHARMEDFRFSTNASADVHWRGDIFDNLVARCFYPQEEDKLVFALEMEVSVTERNPFGFLLESRALQLPVRYDARERELLGPFFGGRDGDFPDGLSPGEGGDTVEALVVMNEWIHGNIAYERREEGEAFTPAETLRAGRGACRDTAVLLVAALRGCGMAARLASGYLWESATDPAERKADSSLHAWTEVYLPGAGWLAMDPSNGVLADHHYLTAAVGLLPEDIAPVAGTYFGDRSIPGRLTTSLKIERS
ncbi:MAG: transglutaminase family protein [Chthoniobacterales bacterium]|nr:transglutaminase family protein [Chthoniobacterales bacterium]